MVQNCHTMNLSSHICSYLTCACVCVYVHAFLNSVGSYVYARTLDMLCHVYSPSSTFSIIIIQGFSMCCAEPCAYNSFVLPVT